MLFDDNKYLKDKIQWAIDYLNKRGFEEESEVDYKISAILHNALGLIEELENDVEGYVMEIAGEDW